jgi:glycosyltransferase involved in cell wall biosynthesis
MPLLLHIRKLCSVIMRAGMKKPAAFSVVIPLYNKERFVARSLKSALAQTHAPIEIIVVDDGSTDNGAAVVEAIAIDSSARKANCCDSSAVSMLDGAPPIVLIGQANAGPSAARNAGIRAARGAYIAFLDADDEWEPEFLAEIALMIQVLPSAGLFTTAFLRLEDVTGRKIARIAKRYRGAEWKKYARDGRAILATEYVFAAPTNRKQDMIDCEPLRAKRVKGTSKSHRRKLGDSAGLSHQMFIVHNLVRGAKSDRISTSATVVRRDVFDSVGCFKEGVRIAQDGEMWLRIALEHDFAYSQRILSINHTDDAVSTTKRLKMNLDTPPNAPNLTAREVYMQADTPQETKDALKSYLNIKEMNYVDRLIQAGYRDEAKRVFMENLIPPVASWRYHFLRYKLFGKPLPIRILPAVFNSYYRKIALNVLGKTTISSSMIHRRYLILP